MAESTSKDDGTWQADAPVTAMSDTLYAFANVT